MGLSNSNKKDVKKMMVTIYILLFILLALVTTTGCIIRIETGEEIIEEPKLGTHTLVRIENDLYYDSTTGIVYWWNGASYGTFATMPNEYYSSNGKLCKYDKETRQIKELEE